MLSSNWKALQKKINKKDDKKVSKKKLPSTKKPKTNLKTLSQITKVQTDAKLAQQETPIVLNKDVSALESTLWNNENPIRVDDIEVKPLVKVNLQRKLEPGKFVAMDCEFVGVGKDGEESALARVSIVNFYGHVLYDKFVKPREKVTDWRTWVSGVTPAHMKDAVSFEETQKETYNILKDRILVGHAIHHDLDALYLSHPRNQIRDTSQFAPFRKIAQGRTPSLKKLSAHFLKIDIQSGSHSSVEDARATMLLFRLYKKEFEESLRRKGTH